MDVSKEILDKLMGRDRNKTKDEIKHRDHYSNKDVCKPFLICFCFNTLFPNTNYDEGPCKMRHDPFLKDMFDSDKNKGDHEKQYLIECINWIEKRLGDVEVRVKKNQALIDSKSNYTSERPKEIVDMLIGIDKEIEETMKQAEIFGQNGQILESERCMNDVERLRQKKREVEAMGDEQANAQKQQKICEICGAIQTINDTEKRITTHLEGKIHQGFLRLRNEIETLRIRLDILNNLNKSKEEPKDKQIKKSRSRSHRKSRSKGKEVKKDKERERERDREREKDKDKDKERVDKQKDRERERDREKQRERERQRDRPRDRERERSKDKDRSHKDQDRNRDRERDRYRDRDHREKSRDRDHKDHKKKHRHDKSRDRESQ